MQKLCVFALSGMVLLMGCRSNEIPDPLKPEPGIALTLARDRAQAIHNLRYDLSFTIPDEASQPIIGREIVRFVLRDPSRPIVLDFQPGRDSIRSVSTRGRPVAYDFVNGHIVIPKEDFVPGENSVEIVFRAGDASLNRNAEFMYALFVPARAHLAFPCFDQPDLKARYTLELTIPAQWQAISNGAEIARTSQNLQTRTIGFTETQPIPTYLFTFAAGKFQSETAERDGRTFHMLHRETDAKKVERNREAIFDLHSKALAWLENYTGIPYPFGKFGFALIPSFQFGGMEHPGSIFYNASSMMLDESATENQMLGRASLIAHETAHMWFGDLVTMRWFNDVWMKEVFANFMAAKIVNPSFPNVNHELRFLVSHYPSAYAVDRTAGTHAIRQELENLNAAGQMYGAIIYQKAPIVMRQLERILGQEKFREGLQVYLKEFQFGNATWLDLVKVLDERTDVDVAAWSRAWVEESGRPLIRTELELNPQGAVQRLAFVQSDPQQGRSLHWTEQMEVVVGAASNLRSIPVELRGERTEVKDASTLPRPDFVLPTGGGLAYGGFTLDDGSRAYLLKSLPELKDPVARGAAWVTLWEELLDRRVRPSDYFDLSLRALPLENTEQNVQLILGRVGSVFWGYLPESARQSVASKLEQTLRSGIDRAASSSLKSAYFSAFRNVVSTKEGIAFLERVWSRQEKIPGLILAEPDEASMALELAVRGVPNAPAIMEEQFGRFQNPDRKARFEFVTPALSANAATRDTWFANLKDVANRRREPWVLEGLRYLHHPLRVAESEKHIRPALDLLLEIQRTGDIFFPKNWMDSTLGGYNSRSAAEIVRKFLSEKPDYPMRLRRIILQSADELFRAADIVTASSS